MEKPVAKAPAATERKVIRRPKISNEKVNTWPHLLVIEFAGAMVTLLILSLLAILKDAPLEALANPDFTTNPAKAPWYFMSLQEMLLHMDASVAGVIIPTIVILMLLALPYIDYKRDGIGWYFATPKGKRIAFWSAVATTIVVWFHILLDEYVMVPEPTHWWQLPEWVTLLGGDNAGTFWYKFWNFQISTIKLNTGVLPLLIWMLELTLWGLIVKKVFRPTTRELVIGVYTALFVAMAWLTFVGTAMRGEGMKLYLPWNMPEPILRPQQLEEGFRLLWRWFLG